MKNLPEVPSPRSAAGRDASGVSSRWTKPEVVEATGPLFGEVSKPVKKQKESKWSKKDHGAALAFLRSLRSAGALAWRPEHAKFPAILAARGIEIKTEDRAPEPGYPGKYQPFWVLVTDNTEVAE